MTVHEYQTGFHSHMTTLPLNAYTCPGQIFITFLCVFFLAYFPQKKRQRIWIQFPFPLSLRSVYVNLSITHYLSSPSSDSPKPNPQFHSANWICTLKFTGDFSNLRWLFIASLFRCVRFQFQLLLIVQLLNSTLCGTERHSMI